MPNVKKNGKRINKSRNVQWFGQHQMLSETEKNEMFRDLINHGFRLVSSLRQIRVLPN
jgi:hypothetical protein